MKDRIHVEGQEITVKIVNDQDYISLTDMVRGKPNAGVIIGNWLRNRNTLEFLGMWEKMHNPDFNSIEFDGIRNQAGLNTFAMSVKDWVATTAAVGIQAKAGRYGGTYAHADIAFDFGYFISSSFRYLLIKEFQRLKSDEYQQKKLEWDYARYLSKVNYDFQTIAIKENIVPRLPQGDQTFAYASEADLLNLVVFGHTARQWREANPNATGNIRDNASILQLTVLANLESHNAHFIHAGASPESRYRALCDIAEKQFTILKEKTDSHLLE